MIGRPITYILPDLGWAILLDVILRDAPVGSAIEVYTLAMFELVCERLTEVARDDVAVRLVDAPTGTRDGAVMHDDDPKLILDEDEWRADKRATRQLRHRQRLERAPEVDAMAWLDAIDRDDMTDPVEPEEARAA